MFAFFRTWIRQNAAGTYQDSERVFVETITQVKRMRAEMALLYEELELGMQMLDAYAVRIESARARARAMMKKPEHESAPIILTSENRQQVP